MPDQNGYPTASEKRHLRKLAGSWKASKTIPLTGMRQVPEYLLSIWHVPEWGIVRGKRLLGQKAHQKRPGAPRYRRWHISTGGWSGNEELIHILKQSQFWVFCWQSSRRGGHYVFDVPEYPDGVG